MSVFREKIAKLGFASKDKLGEYKEDTSLFLCNDETISSLTNPEILLQLVQAKKLKAEAVFFRDELSKAKAQVYLYDRTNKSLDNENELIEIQKTIWSSGVVPIACVFYNTEIKIIDCTQATENNKPKYLETVEYITKATKLYNEQFAVKIKTGTFWEETENKNKFKFSKSAYNILIDWIRVIISNTKRLNIECDDRIVKKVIVQAIMIKYFEERKDEFGNSPFTEKYYKTHFGESNFIGLLQNAKNKKNSQFIDLLDLLSDHLNGNLFSWSNEEKKKIELLDLSDLTEALEGYIGANEDPNLKLMRYYDFSCVPVELISRIYEEFLAGNSDKNKKQGEGIYYTPSHLARLLVDESMPLKKYKEIDLSEYCVLDPACGSGIFLALAFKRLVQWWRLQNNLKLPDVKVLKDLLKCIYGVDKDEQATKLTAFSLCFALSDELSPKVVVSKLKFDDLTQRNIIHSDFFIEELEEPIEENAKNEYFKQRDNFNKLKGKKFSLVIGNPPFASSALSSYDEKWTETAIKIPQGQIALKFLTNSLSLLKENGLQCLIIKSSGLLYNSTSRKFKEKLFSNYNVAQVLDFTPLARNKSLWDNGADVDTAAIFTLKGSPDFEKNILHAIFRRTKINKERIVFEIDDYDLHFISRSDAIHNHHIWKINLLGGGRINSTVEKTKSNSIKFIDYVNKANGIFRTGYVIGKKDLPENRFMYDLETLPITKGINEDGINYKKIKSIDKDTKFNGKLSKDIFEAPNVLMWENIGKQKLPVFLNTEKSFSFKKKVIGLKADLPMLKSIVKNFNENSDFYRFSIFCKSGEVLVKRNTALNKEDFDNLPYIEDRDAILSNLDLNIIWDVNNFSQDFIRHGEKSKAVKKISDKDFKEILKNFGKEYCAVMNPIYQRNNKKFRLSNIDYLNTANSIDSSYIAVVFKYDTENVSPKWKIDKSEIDLDPLTNHEISSRLESKRIIKLYDTKDSIIIIKPNQYRYWLSSIAYRDADKSIIDLTNAEY